MTEGDYRLYIEEEGTGRKLYLDESNDNSIRAFFDVAKKEQQELINAIEITDEASGTTYTWSTLLSTYEKQVMDYMKKMVAGSTAVKLVLGVVGDMAQIVRITEAKQGATQASKMKSYKQQRAGEYGTNLEGGLFSALGFGGVGGPSAAPDLALPDTFVARALGMSGKASRVEMKTRLDSSRPRISVGGTNVYVEFEGEPPTNLIDKNGKVNDAIAQKYFNLSPVDREYLILFKMLEKMKNLVLVELSEPNAFNVEKPEYKIRLSKITVFLVLMMEKIYQVIFNTLNTAGKLVDLETRSSTSHVSGTKNLQLKYNPQDKTISTPVNVEIGTQKKSTGTFQYTHQLAQEVLVLRLTEIYYLHPELFSLEGGTNKMTPEAWKSLLLNDYEWKLFPEGGDTVVFDTSQIMAGRMERNT